MYQHSLGTSVLQLFVTYQQTNTPVLLSTIKYNQLITLAWLIQRYKVSLKEIKAENAMKGEERSVRAGSPKMHQI